MPINHESATERTALLYHVANDHRISQLQHEQDEEARSIISSAVTKEEQQMGRSTVGERLPYNDYTTIDWLHDLVKDSYRFRYIQSRRGIRYNLVSMFEACSGWIAVVIIGTLTACVAFLVDIAVATVSDWKLGYCKKNVFLSREACCTGKTPLLVPRSELGRDCNGFQIWTESYAGSFAIYVAMALVFGIISASVTMLTKSSLPAVGSETANKRNGANTSDPPQSSGKLIYLAAGSGIPEIKTILSGFVIPNFLDLKVLLVKAFGAIFAVATGMCLGKEGPFVHISTCVGYIVGNWFPKYQDNGRKLRELLSSACASGLSVAFGAPIGGVLFSYEEISTYFPRKVLWRAFLCSLFAAIVLKALNPTGTGKLVLFETNYGTDYKPIHYVVFVFLGIAGGVFGGLFCKLNFLWSKWFRSFPIIKKHPVFEVFLVVLATTLLQFPNPLTREPGDVIIKNLLVDCKSSASSSSWVCENEDSGPDIGEVNWVYVGYLVYGTLTKLVLTIITFGCKVPSGVIIPALDAGALFGRLIGQSITSISPGIFAMVGSAAFLAGVCRMTISLAVIMFELTGQLEYVVPHMIAILVAKWVADAISEEGVYDLAQSVLGHPFLDPDTAISIVRRRNLLVETLVPPKQTMDEITVHVPLTNKVPQGLLDQKLEQLHSRGLMDAGLVLVQTHPHSEIPTLQGYISQSELEFGLTKLCPRRASEGPEFQIRLLGLLVDGDASPDTLEVDLSPFVDRTPLSICAKAPLEYAVEMFSKLGLRYLMVTEEGTGRLVGVVIKKRLVGLLEGLKEGLGE
ncbi:chloride channel-like protein 3 [Melanomma pulvis-pyrius CBS 109.77]|uniref:Chloride channel protein n=1 Tax=Melanomma pulvis-pyrius CBS 109.77 TaxID=1314802 RepID=A0A6A6X618_9PLEO|nr:chloride channel-like protein 3 [Melanomma pulvis-pyrius CBS 109.77]